MEPDRMHIVKPVEAIENTFFHLLKEKGFSRISVAEITRRCGIAKGTFYYHYQDKYDLAEKILQNQLRTYNAIFDQFLIPGKSRENTESEELLQQLKDMSGRIVLLCSIRTPEFDGWRIFHDFLQGKFQTQIENAPELNVQESFIVSNLLASMVLSQLEMYSGHQSETGISFAQSTLEELVRCLRYFYQF